MDVLVSLGTNASYLYSCISILHHHFNKHHAQHAMSGQAAYVPTDFFETCAMIISFILFGKYLESVAKGRTSQALSSLMKLAPETALLVNLGPGGQVLSQQEVAAALVHKGDILKVCNAA